MRVEVLKKYNRSRLKGSLIRDLYVYTDGKVRVNAENVETKEFYPDMYSRDVEDWGADSIICAIQEDVDITVSKY